MVQKVGDPNSGFVSAPPGRRAASAPPLVWLSDVVKHLEESTRL